MFSNSTGKRKDDISSSQNFSGLSLVFCHEFPGIKVSCVSWSPDGSKLAIGLKNGKLCLLDNQTLVLQCEHNQCFKGIDCITWSNDGVLIAVAFTNNTISIFNVPELTLLRNIQTGAEKILSTCWFSDNEYVNTVLIRGRLPNERLYIQSYCVETGERQTVYSEEAWDAPDGAFPAWSQNGKFLALSLKNEKFQIWDISVLNKIIELDERYQRIRAVELSHDEENLAFVLDESSIQVWSASSKQRLTGLYKHTKTVYSLSFNHDGVFLASKSSDNTVRLWRCDQWQPVAVIEEFGSDEIALAFHPSQDRLATFDKRNTALRLWKLNRDRLLNPDDPINSAKSTNSIPRVLIVQIGETNSMSGDIINTEGGNYIKHNTGTYVQNMSQDLTQAANQIQDLLEQLQKNGVAVDLAQEQVAKDVAAQAQDDPTVKTKLLKWGQSLGTTTVSDVVKSTVKLAIRSAGIPLP